MLDVNMALQCEAENNPSSSKIKVLATRMKMDKSTCEIPEKFLNSLGFINYDMYGNVPWTYDDTANLFLSCQYKSITNFLGIDCEMVGVGHLKTSALGRVSIVNEYGYCIYDTFVNPLVEITDYRTKFSGIRPRDLATAPNLDVVLQEVADLVRGKTLVGHSIHNDLDVLKLNGHAAIRDTALYFKKLMKHKGLPSLKKLTKKYLNTTIQSGEHSSIQDAQATLKLYLLYREDWEDNILQWKKKANIVVENVELTEISDMHVEPRQTDLFVDSKSVFVRVNKIGEAYFSCEEYLDTHFRLLLEDFLRPLRQTVQDINNKKNVTVTNIKNEVFHSVRIKKFGKDTPSLEVKGNRTLLVPIKANNLKYWEEAGMFYTGALLLLSNDNFKSVKFAVITWMNPEEQLKNPNLLHIHVQFCKEGPSWIAKDSDQFSMIESKAFYAAYKYTLEYLQVVDLYKFPMKKYIVDSQTNSEVPAFLLTQDEKTIDFGVLMNDGSSHKSKPLKLDTWPDINQLNLDYSQYEALKNAMTRELTIIQGPPGTGKTYTTIQLLKMLLTNEWLCQDSPVLIVSYTNHSLDQILELILDFVEEFLCHGDKNETQQSILRIGGGCKSEKIMPLMMMYKEEKIQEKYQLSTSITKYEQVLNSLNELNFDDWIISTGILNFKELPPFIISQLQNNATCQMILHFFEAEEKSMNQNITKWFGLDKNYLVGYQKARGLFLLRCKNLEYLLSNNLEQLFNMVSTNALDSDDLYMGRWALYFFVVNQIQYIVTEMKETLEDWNLQLEQVKHFKSKSQFLKSAKILGMTTTGAVKCKALVQKLKPKIMIVEEAAHVLEAHVVASLTENCQQMILIGDHKQLRPTTADYDLAENYKLHVSLMERLVQNGVAQNNQNWIQLKQQHRMRPEIAAMICPVIYEQLENHPVVLQYPPVQGCNKNLFFIDHKQHEKKDKGSCSFYNEFEAHYIKDALEFFVCRGYYKPTQVAVIVAYLAQKHMLDNMLKHKSQLNEIVVSTVDAYQGKENDIIFLSLVRSNAERQVGFLKTDNRVCVALSRARHGFFMIGNMTCLKSSSKTWKEINKILKETKSIGSRLPLNSQCVPTQNKFIHQPPASSSSSSKIRPNIFWNSSLTHQVIKDFSGAPYLDFDSMIFENSSMKHLYGPGVPLWMPNELRNNEIGEDRFDSMTTNVPYGNIIKVQQRHQLNGFQNDKKKNTMLSNGYEQEVEYCRNVSSASIRNMNLWKDLPCGHRQKSHCHQLPSKIKCNVCTARKDTETRYWDRILAHSLEKL